MTTIEPTEEQREAVRAFVNDLSPQGWFEDRLARLLAEREARLREEYRWMVDKIGQQHKELCDQEGTIDTLRAELKTERLVAEKACAARNDMENALGIYINNDEKCDALLKRAGLDDTVNVVPRLAAIVDETVALRARVAELEGQYSRRVQSHMEDLKEAAAAAGQHLADIKALMGCCRGLVHDVDRLMWGIDVGRHAMVMRATLNRLAHYDDAK